MSVSSHCPPDRPVPGSLNTQGGTEWLSTGTSFHGRVTVSGEGWEDEQVNQKTEPTPIDAVLFDVAGVLLLPDPRVVGARLSSAGISFTAGDFERAHYAGVAEVDEGPPATVPREPYLAVYAEEIGVPEEQRDRAASLLLELWDDEPVAVFGRPARGVPGGLRRLVESGIRCAVVSNSDGTVEEQLLIHGICQVGEGPGVPVAAIVDSEVVGVSKPDAAIFRIGLDAVGATPDRAVYVGDSVRYDVAGAQQAGMHAIHVDPFGSCSGGAHGHVVSLEEVADQLLASRG